MSYVGIRISRNMRFCISKLDYSLRLHPADPTRPDAIKLSKVKKTGDLQGQNSNGSTSSPNGAHAVCPTKQAEPIKNCNF